VSLPPDAHARAARGGASPGGGALLEAESAEPIEKGEDAMIRRMDIETPGVLAYDVEGTITTEDVKRVHTEIEETLKRAGSLRLMIDVREMGGVEPRAVIEDLKLTPEYLRDVDRYAIVGNQRWHEWFSGVTDRLARGEARFFGDGELGQAKAWILEPADR